MNDRRLATLVSLALAAALAARPARAQAPRDTVPVQVAGPTVVVLSPPVGYKAADADADLATGLDDFGWYLALAGRALEKGGVAMDVRFARRVRLSGAGAKRDFVPGGEHGGTEFLLVRPGRAPKVVRGGMTELPRAAADYFDLPAIAPAAGKRDG